MRTDRLILFFSKTSVDEVTRESDSYVQKVYITYLAPELKIILYIYILELPTSKMQ